MLLSAISPIRSGDYPSDAIPVVVVKLQIARLCIDQQDEAVLTAVATTAQDSDLMFSEQGKVEEHSDTHINSGSLPLSSFAVGRTNARPFTNRIKRGNRPTLKREPIILYNNFNALDLFTLPNLLSHDLQFRRVYVATHAAGVLLQGASLDHLRLNEAAFAVRGM
jgi:hypothetical protein